MNFELIKDVVDLLEKFNSENINVRYPSTIEGFKKWISDQESEYSHSIAEEIYWEGKENGRTPESVIATSLVHLNRYAKTYSKAAIADSDFATQEDFIYLINLKALGAMTKMELIKKNIHDKPVGILIINRLIKQNWVEQTDSTTDKRTKVIKITEKGLHALEAQMVKIRRATHIVAGNLNYTEKMELIHILNKLDHFHSPIFSRNIETRDLIETVYSEYSFEKN
ncbi:putative transcriptional regulator [Chryseobacterium sp. H1D6B]|uniref:MarR family winged helix-turn-helix transcriptional regulator n=1 Tax=Chryseobacterium sp. H1D6B TaxID=2940588 RepID=UPI0015CA4E5A|nr:MarR family transcriptional regulator [Chryseobacterium sp. H1D6B]MDH6253840.1 putative transcriptional regulator [Chryseobacterium sp. H1D6B]